MIGEIARRPGGDFASSGAASSRRSRSRRRFGACAGRAICASRPRRRKRCARRELLVLAGGTQGEPGRPWRASPRERTRIVTDRRRRHGDPLEPHHPRQRPRRVRARRATSCAAALASTRESRIRGSTRVATRPGSEQTPMIDLVAPRCFLPVHGTLHHLRRHGALARECRVNETLVVENGTAVLCDGQRVVGEGTVPSGVVTIGMGGGPLGAGVLRDCHELGRAGNRDGRHRARSRRAHSLRRRRRRPRRRPPSTTRWSTALCCSELTRVAEIAKKRRSSDDVLRDETRRACGATSRTSPASAPRRGSPARRGLNRLREASRCGRSRSSRAPGPRSGDRRRRAARSRSC